MPLKTGPMEPGRAAARLIDGQMRGGCGGSVQKAQGNVARFNRSCVGIQVADAAITLGYRAWSARLLEILERTGEYGVACLNSGDLGAAIKAGRQLEVR